MVMKIQVVSLDNKKVGDITLNKDVFGVEVRRDILARVVNWQLAKRRQGTHSTRTVSEVSGSGKKMFRQKGTGNARQGEHRNIHQRGGATYGPSPRDYTHSLQKKVRALGLKCALSQKAAENKLIILDSLNAESHKTQDLKKKFDGLNLRSVLVLGGSELNENFVRAASNIPLVDVLPHVGANVYDILRRDALVLTQDAVKSLEDRLK